MIVFFTFSFRWHGVQHGRLNNNKGATVWMAARNVAGEYIQVSISRPNNSKFMDLCHVRFLSGCMYAM